MPISNDTVIQGGFKASAVSTSYVELYLTQIHGNLHEVIPKKLASMTQSEIADYLSTDEYTVTQSWLSKWLNRNGYSRRWVRRQGGES